MDVRYKLYCDFRDAYVAAHSSLKADRALRNAQAKCVCGRPQGWGRGLCPDVDKSGQGGGGQFLLYFADILHG